MLVGDDQHAVLEAVRFVLKGDGHSAVTVDNPAAVLRCAQTDAFDLILIDLNYARDTTSGKEGLDLLEALHAAGTEAPVIVMTAWGSIELAVEAMRRGACDFVQKPWDNERLLEAVRKQAGAAAARAASRRRSRSEMEIARAVQQKLLPKPTRELATLKYAAHCAPAGDIGGDSYDFFDMGPSHMGFLLADVSGKGIGAAMLMAHLQAAFRSRVSQSPGSVAAIVQEVNRLFYESTPPEQYSTLFFARYDDASRRLSYINAGHPAPVLVRASGAVERLDTTATVVGAFPLWSSAEETVVLGPGDTLVVFSDGVVEAGLETGLEFGDDALVALLCDRRSADAESLVSFIITTVLACDPARHDDLTVLAMRGI